MEGTPTIPSVDRLGIYLHVFALLGYIRRYVYTCVHAQHDGRCLLLSTSVDAYGHNKPLCMHVPTAIQNVTAFSLHMVNLSSNWSSYHSGDHHV